MRVIDIIGKHFGKYTVDYFRVNLNGDVEISYISKPLHFQELLQEMKESGVEFPKGPHAFDPNEYIGMSIGGLKILGNMDKDSNGKYNYRGPEPTIQIDPELYQNSITLDFVEPWVEIPKGEMIWCECNHCKSILHLPVEIVFDRCRYSYKCGLCDAFDEILREAKIYNSNKLQFSNIELCRMVKTDNGIKLSCKCHRCNRKMLISKEDYYRMRSNDKCDKCIKDEERVEAEHKYDAVLNKFNVNISYTRKHLNKYFKNIKAQLVTDKYTGFDPSNIEIIMTCRKCGRTFSTTYDKFNDLASYGKIDRCPDCVLKEYEDIDSRIGEKYFKLTFLGKVKRTSRKLPKVICQCQCGNKIIILYSDYKTGKYRSCCQCPNMKTRRVHDLPKLYKERKEKEDKVIKEE